MRDLAAGVLLSLRYVWSKQRCIKLWKYQNAIHQNVASNEFLFRVNYDTMWHQQLRSLRIPPTNDWIILEKLQKHSHFFTNLKVFHILVFRLFNKNCTMLTISQDLYTSLIWKTFLFFKEGKNNAAKHFTFHSCNCQQQWNREKTIHSFFQSTKAGNARFSFIFTLLIQSISLVFLVNKLLFGNLV